MTADFTLPVPPPECQFVGDGDYLAIGAEFLDWFIRLGDLQPTEAVLDVGSGIGRMAVPLTQYLTSGTYDGFDIVREGVDWCRDNIAARFPHFHFRHLDLRHPLYNPQGRLATTEVRLPYEDGQFDFVFMTSVLTHLAAPEIRAYAREIRRVMRSGARFFLTAFTLNPPSRTGLQAGGGALPFDGASPFPEIEAYPESPGAAVAFDEDFFLAMFLEAGLRRRRPAWYGRWSGRTTPSPSFQDVFVLEIQYPDPARVGAHVES